MKKMLLAMLLVLIAMILGCDKTVQGPFETIERVVCVDSDDCSFDSQCRMFDLDGTVAKFCVPTCEWEQTPHGDVVWDSCNRFYGEGENYWCIPTAFGNQCVPWTSEHQPSDPQQEQPPATVQYVTVKACYAAVPAGSLGQISYAVKTAAGAWTAARDLPVDASGCFATSVEKALLQTDTSDGSWYNVDLTQGPAQRNVWYGSSMKPSVAYIDGRVASVGLFVANFGWQIRP
jgi:hypothetical protein